MRSALIVILSPGCRLASRIEQVLEPAHIEKLVAQFAVKTLNPYPHGRRGIDAAEKIVSLLRAAALKEGSFRAIVPDFAKSLGTLIGLAADKLLMSDQLRA